MEINLEFLRPEWFLALLPALWLAWKAWQIKTHQGQWQQVIEPKFQKLLLGNNLQTQSQTGIRLAIIGLGFIWLISIIALAGPSLKSVELPAQKTQQGTVIILDLSLSMLADDVMPNRISRARFKLVDLLKKHPEQSIGLIAYAGTAHSITPISEDNGTLLELLPVLSPLIMPEYGSEPLAAMQLAEKMFAAAQINQGHLIWVTDDIEPDQRTAIQSWLNKRNISLSILAVGTQAGGTVQIPNYGLLRDENEQLITPQLPYKELQTLSQATGAALTPLKVDDSDLALLIPSNLAAVSEQKKQQQKEKEILHKLDDGSALILIILPLLAFAYRRGWLFSLSLLMFLPLGSVYSPPSYAEPSTQTEQNETQLPKFTEVFQTGDQQAYEAWKNNDLQAAEALFESPQWRASTLYRLKRYAEAEAQFKKDPSAKGRYNLGNALAQQGKLEAAQKAYQQALTLQPDFEDAQSNLDLVTQLLEQQKSADDNPAGQSKDDSGQAESKDSQAPDSKKPQENKPPSDDESQPDSATQPQPENQSPPADSQNKQAQQPNQQQQTTDSAENNEAKQAQPDQKDQAASSQLDGDSAKDGQQDNPETNPEKPTDSQAGETEGQTGDEGQEKDAQLGAEQASESNESTGEESNPTTGLSEQNQKEEPSAEALEEIKESEQQRATDNWLKQIPDQPGLFLKRKFEYQYQQQNAPSKNRQDSEKTTPSKAAEKIW